MVQNKVCLAKKKKKNTIQQLEAQSNTKLVVILKHIYRKLFTLKKIKTLSLSLSLSLFIVISRIYAGALFLSLSLSLSLVFSDDCLVNILTLLVPTLQKLDISNNSYAPCMLDKLSQYNNGLIFFADDRYLTSIKNLK